MSDNRIREQTSAGPASKPEWVWKICDSCGKEFCWRHHMAGWLEPDAFIATCKVCQTDRRIGQDRCPETVKYRAYGFGGLTDCRLSYRHAGRCEPDTSNLEAIIRSRFPEYLP